MAAVEEAGLESPPTRRLEALADIGLWLLAVGLVEGASLLWLAKASFTAQVLLGEPLGMVFLIAALTLIIRRRGQSWRDLGLAAPVSWKRTIGLAAGGYAASLCLNAILVLLVLRPLGVPEANVKVILPVIDSPASLAAMIALACTTVAFGEEMMFRGFLFTRLETLSGRSRLGTGAALAAQAMLFGLPHLYQGLGGAVTTAGIGLVLGVLYLINRRNLSAGIMTHATADTLSLGALYLLHAYKLI